MPSAGRGIEKISDVQKGSVTSNDGSDRPIGGIESFTTPHPAPTILNHESRAKREKFGWKSGRKRRFFSYLSFFLFLFSFPFLFFFSFSFSRMNRGVEAVSRFVRGNTHSPAGSRKGERSELGVATEHGAGKWRLWSIDTSVGGWFSPFPRRWPAASYGEPEDGVAEGCSAAMRQP